MVIFQHEDNLDKLRLPNEDTLTATMERLTIPELVNPVMHMVECINRVTEFADRNERVSLLTNLDFMRITSSTDERDKVYAAFGISNPAETTTIDYTLPVRDVYTKVAQQSILAHKGYAILSFCKYPSQGSTRLGLPTWVPDWADRKPQHNRYLPFFHTGVAGMIVMDENIKKLLYRAAAGSILKNLRFEDDGLTLVVPGVVPDKLTFISSTLALETKSSEVLASAKFRQPHNPGNSDEQHAQESPQTPWATFNNMQWLREWAAQQPQEAKNLDWQRYIRAYNWKFHPQGPPDQFEEPIYVPTGEGLDEAYHITLLAGASPFEDLKEQGQGFEFDFENRLEDGFEKLRSLFAYLIGRRFAVSQFGLLALVPAEAREGDIIAIVEGAELPFLLRPVGQDKTQFVGLCYVHGIMDGSAWHWHVGAGQVFELKIV